jgi:hypothetical protein
LEFLFYGSLRELRRLERLQSHLIPVKELANDGYENLGEEEKREKVRLDFDAFLRARARLVSRAVKQLSDGRQLSASELCAS